MKRNILPLSIHVEDDGLVGGGSDDGPEGVLGDLGDLAHSGGGGVEAGADGEGKRRSAGGCEQA